MVAILGFMFTAGSLLSLIRAHRLRWRNLRDVLLLVGLVAIFIVELTSGLQLIARPQVSGPAQTIAVLVVACFLVGIARAWELIGGPTIGLGHEIGALMRNSDRRGDAAEDDLAAHGVQRPGAHTEGAKTDP